MESETSSWENVKWQITEEGESGIANGHEAFLAKRADERFLKSSLFDRVWENPEGFTCGTDGTITPMLETFVRRLKKFRKKYPKKSLGILEGGAGGGAHSIQIVKALREKEIPVNLYAVETSGHALSVLNANLEAEGEQIAEHIHPLQVDLYDVALAQKMGWSGAYFNSVLHFFHPADRYAIYHALSHCMSPGAPIAVSFKARGDALESDGVRVRKIPGGVLVRGSDDIIRAFIDDPSVLEGELRGAGFVFPHKTNDWLHEWEVGDYNIPGKAGKFVGLVGKKMKDVVDDEE